MKMLAIDPGFERVGIAVIQKRAKEKEKLLYSDCFKTSSKLPFSKRLLTIGNEIEKIIKKYKPGGLAIETLLFNTNQKTAMRVAEARGTIIFISKKSGLQIFEYTPLQVKMAITGYGHATKDQVAAMIPRLITLDDAKKKLDDELDAIAIGLTHYAYSAPVEK